MHGTCIAASSHRMKLYYQRLEQEPWNSEAPEAPPHRKTTSAVARRDFGYEFSYCGDAESRSYTAEYYPHCIERCVHGSKDITTGRRRRARGLRSFENTADETGRNNNNNNNGRTMFL